MGGRKDEKAKERKGKRKRGQKKGRAKDREGERMRGRKRGRAKGKEGKRKGGWKKGRAKGREGEREGGRKEGREKEREEGKKHGGAKPIPLPSKDHQSAVILLASTLSLPNLAWKKEILSQSNWHLFWDQNVQLWLHISWRHSYVNLKFLKWISQLFHYIFKRTIPGKLKAETFFPVSQIWNEIWHFESG